MRLILNGKKAQLPEVRQAIETIRSKGTQLDVRVTYEYGDIQRFVSEAIHDKVSRLIIGGGDGTLNEMVHALAKSEKQVRPELAILPLGTANDFATASHIPLAPLEAIELVLPITTPLLTPS